MQQPIADSATLICRPARCRATRAPACQPCGARKPLRCGVIRSASDNPRSLSSSSAAPCSTRKSRNTCTRATDLELFRIDEVGVERDRVGLAEQLHEAAVLLDQIVRQHRDAESALTRAQDAEDVVDGDMRRARALAVASDLDQPARRLQIGRDVAAEQQNAVSVEILDIARRTEALEILGRRIGMEVHGEQLALDQIRLGRLAQADRHVGLAHGEIELLVGGDQLDADVRIQVDEFAEPRGEPVHADADRGGHLEVAVRPLAAVGQLGARRLEFHEDFMRGAVEQFALFGEDQPARVAVEQRDRELLLECAHLPRDGRLRKPELLARVGEAAGFGGGVKNLELVPVHDAKPLVRPCGYENRFIRRRRAAPSRHARRGSVRLRAPPCSPGRQRSPPGDRRRRSRRRPQRRPARRSRSSTARS